MRQTFGQKRKNGVINKVEHKCKLCGSIFYDWASNHRKYCSRSCLSKDQYASKLGKISHDHLRGERNCNWKGDDLGYSAVHMWIRSKLGRAIKCTRCGETNGRIEWANINGKYRRKIEDFISLCKSCHIKQDGLYIEHPSYGTLYQRAWRAKRRGLLV